MSPLAVGLNMIPADPLGLLDVDTWAPYCTPKAAIPVEEVWARLKVFATWTSEEPFTAYLRFGARDQASASHVGSVYWPQLMAIPV